MPRLIKAAAVMMDVKPAATADRLQRAGDLIEKAAQAGAELVALPEVFNTGYAYVEANYRNAESADGPTVSWMRKRSAELNIHLAGTLLLKESTNGGTDIRNALFLFAPDGRSWRYDKNYPWSWEYAYSIPTEDRPRTVIAHTDLGDIGFLTCWDAAHAGLWKEYAGKVDMMILCSSPPDAFNAILTFSKGEIGCDNMGGIVRGMRDEGSNLFIKTVREQLAWLGVPGISAMPCGIFETPLPNGSGTYLAYTLTAPVLLKYIGQAGSIAMRCPMTPACQIVGPAGEVLALADANLGESFIMSEILIPDRKPIPQKEQPRPAVRSSSFFLSDKYIPWLTRPLYRKAKGQGLF